MPTQFVLVVNLVTAAVLIAAATSDRVMSLGSRLAGLAFLPLLNGALLAAYVFGEDSYRNNGVSRWDAYRSPGGALGPMFVVSLVVLASCAGLLLYAALRARRPLFRASALGGGVACLLLVTLTVAGFSLN